MPTVTGTRAALAGAAMTVLLTSCGSTTPEPAAASPSASTPVSAPAPSPSSPSPTGFPKAADGDDLDACGDAECEVLVHDGDKIRLDDGLGLAAPLDVTVTGDSVTFTSVTAGGMRATLSHQTPDQGGPSRINDISLAVIAVEDRKAVITVEHV
ncbi:hypothetical protein E1293_12520 [Actinomadura darangshiensis]|uniref:Uncharacterized protein n=1 Tax=Actinomadura darangshiensis TaxID=705336 RepID=A0A4V2YWA5_9ACTN|nr:hypothetical protein [Actinomadura darangshiensis]TDD84617.1 hypothetical protein E1293_12520 [Actinomadura darangshiensis]